MVALMLGTTTGRGCRAILVGLILTLALGLILPLALGVAPAAAQPPADLDRTPLDGVPEDAADKATKFQASEYHKAGVAAWKGNRFGEALRMFRQGYGIVRRAETRLMIARTLAAQNRPAEAFDEAVAASAEAAPPIAGQAEQLVASLQQKVAIVTVEVTGGLEGTAVVVNGKPLDEAKWGNPIPLLPGTVTVVATNTGGEVTETAEVAAGAESTIKVVAPGKPAPAVAAPVAPEPVAAPAQASTSGDGAGAWFMDHRRSIGIVTATAGGIFLINFGIFGLLSNGQADRLEHFCPDPNDCDPRFSDDRDRGRRFQTVANVMVGLGAVTLAAGAGLIVWDLLDDGGGTTEAARLTIGPGTVAVEGSF
jgi:hypothetical protein